MSMHRRLLSAQNRDHSLEQIFLYNESVIRDVFVHFVLFISEIFYVSRVVLQADPVDLEAERAVVLVR